MTALTQYLMLSVLLIPTVGTAAYTASDRTPCAEITSTQLRHDQVHAGDLLQIDYGLTKMPGCTVKAMRLILDGGNTQISFEPDVHFGDVAQEKTIKTMSVMVPRGAIQGNAQFRLQLSTSNGWFQAVWPVVTTQKDVNFSIIPPLPPGA